MSSSLKDVAGLTGLMAQARPGPIIARVVRVDAEARPCVDLDGEEIPARHLASVRPEMLRALAQTKAEVLVQFEHDDPHRPIIVGVMQPLDAPARVRIEGEDELVLSCGEASITLRRNGKVVIRGTHLVSDSLGANWIRGADIQLG